MGNEKIIPSNIGRIFQITQDQPVPEWLVTDTQPHEMSENQKRRI